MTTPQRLQTAGYLVWQLSTKWRVAVDRTLQRFGLTHAHYLVLGSLAEFTQGGEKPSQRELADFAGLEVMYVSKLVRQMETSGLVRRADHPGDPRAFQLTLTARGVDRVAEAAAAVRALFDQLLRPIGGRSSKKHDGLTQTLDSLLDAAEAFNRANRAGAPARIPTASLARRRRQ